MTLKKLLGLEDFPILETEIMSRLQEAYRNKQEIVEFCCGNTKVKVRIRQIWPEGMMREYEGYYAR